MHVHLRKPSMIQGAPPHFPAARPVRPGRPEHGVRLCSIYQPFIVPGWRCVALEHRTGGTCHGSRLYLDIYLVHQLMYAWPHCIVHVGYVRSIDVPRCRSPSLGCLISPRVPDVGTRSSAAYTWPQALGLWLFVLDIGRQDGGILASTQYNLV